GKNGDNSSDADANASTPLGGSVDGANGPGGGAGANGMLGTAGNSAILTDSGTLIACPKKNQTILILDFKSGWWAGDGGNFFQKITNSLQGTCTQQVTIEYHHIVTDGGGGGLFFPNLNGIQNTMLVVPGGTPTDGSSDFNSAFRDSTFA